jgi:hypothetical protein
VTRRPSAAALCAAACALACASSATLSRPGTDAGHASASTLARAGFDAYVLHNDPATAARRFDEAVRRGPRDPRARFGAALLARRRLDTAAEVTHLVALVDGAPDHPLALPAARRLAELAELAPPMARAISTGLAQVAPRARGLAATRVRAARAAAAAALGDVKGAEALRAQSGAVTAWTLAGPFGALHVFDFATRYAPEEGAFPASAAAPAAPSRTVPSPDGNLTLEGESGGGDIFYAAADVTLSRGGDYLATVGSTASLRAFVDGQPLAERIGYAERAPLIQAVPVTLPAGRHRLLVKLAHGSARGHVAVFLARADGGPSDATFAPAEPGAPSPAVRPGPLPKALDVTDGLVAALEDQIGPAAARLVVARDVMGTDREAAKALLAAALARAPGSAAVLSARAEARWDDPSLAERIAHTRAEADAQAALAADPGDAIARLRLAELARSADRLDDAAALLDGLSEADAARPRALLTRARVAQARGLGPRAEQLAEEARRTGGDCSALELLFELAVRRDAIGQQDELVAALAHCPGGLERTAAHARRRGDLDGALKAANALVRASPARISARLSRASLLAARGDPAAAAGDLADLAKIWPRDPRIEKRRAEYLEMAGDLASAKAARERALRLDGGDLSLRRALALETGHEPLDDLDEDGLAAIKAYRAAAPAFDTSSVTVLDFGALEAHPGGAFTERVHTVVEARDQRAVDRFGEVGAPEGAELLLARTVKRDGRILEPEELGSKRTISLQGLEPGDFAEWAWIRSSSPRGASVPGFTADAFYFRGDTPLWRSTYVAVAPAGVPLDVDAHRMAQPERKVVDGRTVVRVLRERVAPLPPEPNSVGDPEQVEFVQMGAGAGPDAFGRALADGMIELFRPNREIRALAAEIEASVPAAERSTDALVRAAYARVDQLILGRGGGFAEPASAILSRGRGNRTVLLKAVLDVLGVRTRVALVRDFTKDPAVYRFPRPDLYGYALLRVERGGAVQWLDLTLRGAPYGTFPNAIGGMSAMVLPAPGEAVTYDRTSEPGSNDRRTTRVHVALDADGSATVDGTELYTGFDAAAIRSGLEKMDTAARRQGLEQALARSFRSPELLDLSVDGENALGGPLTLHWRLKVPRWVRIDGDSASVDTSPFPMQLGARFVQRASRESPMLVAYDERSTLQLTVTPPPGWRAVPVPPAQTDSPFGRYRRVERVENGELVREDLYDLRRGRIAPADFRAFSSFASTVDSAQEVPMAFERKTQGPSKPGPSGA